MMKYFIVEYTLDLTIVAVKQLTRAPFYCISSINTPTLGEFR